MHRLANDLRRARLRVPGVRPPELESFAERAGRSFLATAENALALAQNLAVARHPNARWLHKVDEDVVIAERHFERMLDGYRRVLADGRFVPGFCAPLLNVNGFSYRLFLEALGLEDVFAGHFSFGPQDDVMRPALSELAGGLEPSAALARD